MPKISIVVPIYNMPNAIALTTRNIESILAQTFRDFEIIVTDDSDGDELKTWLSQYPVKYFRNPGSKGMANNTNHGLNRASGELVKILFQDDYFYDEACLWDIVRHFTPYTMWMATPCLHSLGDGRLINEHRPFYSESQNTIGSPSVITLRREIQERFDPRFHWVLDLDLYRRLFRKYGLPKVTNRVNVVIGLHQGQMTNLLTDERKILEFELLKDKYENDQERTL